MAARKILVVDDDFEIREAISDVLGDEGFTVDTAEHGAAALEYLRQRPKPCLVLLDLMMPVMDGRQFCEEQSRDPNLRDVRVVVVSAASPNEVAAACPTRIGHLRKPLDLDDLVSIVRANC